MDQRLLPPADKNAVFRLIQDAGLDPLDFKWSVVKGPWAWMKVSQLTHPASGAFFLFDAGEHGGYHPQRWPAPLGDNFSVPDSRWLDVVAGWIKVLAPQLLEPDLWRLAEEQRRFPNDPGASNTPFTPAEQARVAEGLKQLEAYVYDAEPDLPEEKRKAVAARFTFLKKAAERLGRIDWMTMVVGQMFGMVTEKLIKSQTFHGLYNMATSVFGKVVEVGGNVIGGLLSS